MSFLNLNSALIIFASAIISLFLAEKRRGIFLLILSAGLIYEWGGAVAFGILSVQVLLAYVLAFWLKRSGKAVSFWICIALELVPLIFFKISAVPAIKTTFPDSLIAPLGLSFYTFQILSYLIEVQWKQMEPEKNIFHFASYIFFFGNKIAGPIERPSLMQQLRAPPTPESRQLLKGAFFIWLGLFQKFVLADHIGEYVLPVFQHPGNYSGLTDTVAVLLSKYQIFCDFSGISVIAVGVGDLFGLNLTLNFARPFAALSIRDFWRRWHISLQSWIRDYVFFPSLSTPLARWGLMPPLILAFVLFGLWHGFLWTFVIYGVIQAVLVRFEPSKFLKKLGWPVVVAVNYIFLICLPSILFRSSSLAQAWAIFRHLGVNALNWSFFTQLGTMKLTTLALFAVLNESWLWLETRVDVYDRMNRLPWILKLAIAVGLLTLLILFSKFDPNSVFIYSRF